MGRDKTGKNQETAAIKANTAQQTADINNRNTQLKGYGASVDKLEANPGYTPEQLAGMRARNAALLGGTYLGAEDTVKRSAAAAGHSNDVGIAPWIANLARDKATMETGRNLDYLQDNAKESLDTRRMIPGMRYAPATLYQGSASNLAGVNQGLISGRMNADSQNSFGQQLLLAAVAGGSQVAASAAGKKS